MLRACSSLLLVGAIMIPGCTVPDTLGLVCEVDAHCNEGQHCGPAGTCAPGPGPITMPTDGLPPPTTLPPMTGGTGDGSSSGATSIGLDSTGSSSGSSGEASTTGSTGVACGRALGTCDAVDVLFVIDNSDSMGDDNGALIAAFSDIGGLIDDFTGGLCSFHIGLTTTESEPDFQPVCQQLGALSRAGALCKDPFPGEPDHPPYIDQDDNVVSALGCLIAVGTGYDDDEKQLDTILAAVGPDLNGPGGCNEGFIRDGVPLVVVLVTDEDDDDDSQTPGEASYRTGSEDEPDDWWDDLTAIKDPSELAVVLIAPTDPGGCGWMPDPTDDDGMGGEFASRIITFLQFFTAEGFGDHFRAIDLCQPTDGLTAEVDQLGELFDAVCMDIAG